MVPNLPSFKGYGKVNEAEQESLDARRKTRKRISIIALSSILLAGIVAGAVIEALRNNAGKPDSGDSPSKPDSFTTSIKALCGVTLYPNSCFSSLSPIAESNQVSPEELFRLSLKVAMDELTKVSGKLETATGNSSKLELDNCHELLGFAIDQLNSSLSTTGDLTLPEIIDDLRTFLSAAGTYLQTCLDGFVEATSATEESKNQIRNALQNSTEFTSNSLAILDRVFEAIDSLKLRRRLLGYSGEDWGKFPPWLSSGERRILQSSDPRVSADVVVAKDGSGKYLTIMAAISAVPEKSKKRFVIYVKKGLYIENAIVDKNKWNVMIVGDGMEATVVSGSRNFVDGTPTFSTATFAVFGKGFIATNIGFVNTAGPVKQQAVALMSSSDQSVFFRCRMDAFQDTLYTQSLRQFYRECNIFGTVDFIFGNSAVVLQNCTIRAKKPIPGQQNTITAQGKFDPNQNTGISIQKSVITAAESLNSVKTYLGRPWKAYSTTIFMQSRLDSLIDPTGWLAWMGNSAPNTISYAEFQNTGPGSSTRNRVKWKGYSSSSSSKQATKFTVNSFIHGNNWIFNAGVPYNSDL